MVGQFDKALATIDRAIAQIVGTGDSFDMPEMLRIKGDILTRLATPQSAQAEDLFLRSLDLACKVAHGNEPGPPVVPAPCRGGGRFAGADL